jgi:hypothetical protein
MTSRRRTQITKKSDKYSPCLTSRVKTQRDVVKRRSRCAMADHQWNSSGFSAPVFEPPGWDSFLVCIICHSHYPPYARVTTFHNVSFVYDTFFPTTRLLIRVRVHVGGNIFGQMRQMIICNFADDCCAVQCSADASLFCHPGILVHLPLCDC